MVVFVLNLKSQSVTTLFLLPFSVLKKILKLIFFTVAHLQNSILSFLQKKYIFFIFSYFVFQAKEIMSSYQTGILENSAKMVLLFHLIEEGVKKRDKLLVFR